VTTWTGDLGKARQARPPSRGELIASAAITVVISAVIGIAATALVGSVGLFVDIAMTNPSADAATSTGIPAWLTAAMLLLVLLLVWPASCRLGVGTPGAGVMELRALGPEGEPISRRKVWLCAGVPVGLMGVASLVGRPGVGAALLVVLWAPCLLRRDRRTTFDLLLGVTPHTTATPRTATPHPWGSVRRDGSEESPGA